MWADKKWINTLSVWGGGILVIQVIILAGLGLYKNQSNDLTVNKVFWSSSQGAPDAKKILDAANNSFSYQFYNKYEILDEFIVFFYHCADANSGKVFIDIEDTSKNIIYTYSFEPQYIKDDVFCLMGHPQNKLKRGKYYNIVIRLEDMSNNDYLEVGISTDAQNQNIFKAEGDNLFTKLEYTCPDITVVKDVLERWGKIFLLMDCVGICIYFWNKKRQDIRRPSKGFCLWMITGLVIFVALMGGFTLLARPNVCNINLEELAGQSEQLSFSEGNLTVTSDESQMYFCLDKDIVINYLDISVRNLSAPTVNARLYYADAEDGFNETDSVGFYLNRGFNEIKTAIGAKKYLRLDIRGGSFAFDTVAFSSAVNPVYQIPQGFFFFMLIWCMLYFMAAKLGVYYTGVHDGMIMLLEGMFATFIIIIMLFAIGRIRWRLMVYMLIPFTVFILAVFYSKFHQFYNIKRFVFAVLIGMTGIMCFVGYNMLSMQHTDLGTVYYSAWEIVNDGRVNTAFTGKEQHAWVFEASNNDYFVHYHNNIPILFIFACFYKILSVFGLGPADLMSNYMSVLLNIAFIMSAVVFGMLAAKNLFGDKGMFVYLLASVFFVPYYINACRYYTDTLSMPFVSLACWLYTMNNEKFKMPFMKYVFIGLTLGIGTLVKGSVVIMLVAVFMHLILTSNKNIRYALLTVILVIGTSTVWNIYIKNCSWIDMSNNDALECPSTHYIMMGINRDSSGNFSLADVNYTEQYASKAEKQKANIEKIKQRIVSFGSLDELGEYEFSKAAITWFDGQYMQDEHISWGIKKGMLYDGLITGRKYNNLFKIYTQVFTFIMHIFVIVGGLFSIKKPKADYAMFLRLTMLGVILFFMLWESKSRYILNFTPVFMLAAIYGIEEINKRFRVKNV